MCRVVRVQVPVQCTRRIIFQSNGSGGEIGSHSQPCCCCRRHLPAIGHYVTSDNPIRVRVRTSRRCAYPYTRGERRKRSRKDEEYESSGEKEKKRARRPERRRLRKRFVRTAAEACTAASPGPRPRSRTSRRSAAHRSEPKVTVAVAEMAEPDSRPDCVQTATVSRSRSAATACGPSSDRMAVESSRVDADSSGCSTYSRSFFRPLAPSRHRHPSAAGRGVPAVVTSHDCVAVTLTRRCRLRRSAASCSSRIRVFVRVFLFRIRSASRVARSIRQGGRRVFSVRYAGRVHYRSTIRQRAPFLSRFE